MMDRNDWADRELAEAESYGITFKTALANIISQLKTLPVGLSEDKRDAVELTVLLELAAEVGTGRLQLADDDFATYACEVYMRTHH
jgi:hypothetical protein